MHGALIDVAEWLGYEVIEVEGEYVLRQRATGPGHWVEREARATAAEIHLYAAVRALMMVPGSPNDVGMRVVAKALGMDTSDGISLKGLLDEIAELLTRERRYREAYLKAEALVNELREALLAEESQAKALNTALMANSRVGPKGGDRGELARQVKLGAIRMMQNHPDGCDPIVTSEGNAICDMADLVLRLLGEEPPTRKEWMEKVQ